MIDAINTLSIAELRQIEQQWIERFASEAQSLRDADASRFGEGSHTRRPNVDFEGPFVGGGGSD